MYGQQNMKSKHNVATVHSFFIWRSSVRTSIQGPAI